MIIFRSDNEENIEFAIKHGVWQTKNRPADEIKPGDVICIQLTGTKLIRVVGIATTSMYEDAPFAWPKKQEQGYTKTVRFEPVDLSGMWPFKTIREAS